MGLQDADQIQSVVATGEEVAEVAFVPVVVVYWDMPVVDLMAEMLA
jgi:hypothetical protein